MARVLLAPGASSMEFIFQGLIHMEPSWVPMFFASVLILRGIQGFLQDIGFWPVLMARQAPRPEASETPVPQPPQAGPPAPKAAAAPPPPAPPPPEAPPEPVRVRHVRVVYPEQIWVSQTGHAYHTSEQCYHVRSRRGIKAKTQCFDCQQNRQT